MKYQILRTPQFNEWFEDQPLNVRLRVQTRLYKIENEGYFGVINKFDGLVELKWGSGLRVYTAILKDALILVILGGNKNGQQKDITKAQRILKAFADGV